MHRGARHEEHEEYEDRCMRTSVRQNDRPNGSLLRQSDDSLCNELSGKASDRAAIYLRALLPSLRKNLWLSFDLFQLGERERERERERGK